MKLEEEHFTNALCFSPLVVRRQTSDRHLPRLVRELAVSGHFVAPLISGCVLAFQLGKVLVPNLDYPRNYSIAQIHCTVTDLFSASRRSSKLGGIWLDTVSNAVSVAGKTSNADSERPEGYDGALIKLSARLRMAWLGSAHNPHSYAISLGELIHVFRTRESTEPGDKIYALLV